MIARMPELSLSEMSERLKPKSPSNLVLIENALGAAPCRLGRNWAPSSTAPGSLRIGPPLPGEQAAPPSATLTCLGGVSFERQNPIRRASES